MLVSASVRVSYTIPATHKTKTKRRGAATQNERAETCHCACRHHCHWHSLSQSATPAATGQFEVHRYHSWPGASTGMGHSSYPHRVLGRHLRIVIMHMHAAHGSGGGARVTRPGERASLNPSRRSRREVLGRVASLRLSSCSNFQEARLRFQASLFGLHLWPAAVWNVVWSTAHGAHLG